ncbi:MAG: hypothetical protein HYT39_00010 [Candidatus Sungbacteria bacterium]|nr:hypothetical protein [Candidatus Sungbacteria bacterium]
MPKIAVERGENLKKGTIAKEILSILRDRPAAFSSRRDASISDLFLPRLEKIGIGRKRKNSIRVAIERLRRQKFLEHENSGNKTLLRLTATGEKRLRQYNLENLKLKNTPRWDGLWRVVMFDIPENKKQARDALSKKLNDMNFYKLQKSVFAHFLPCEDEIEFICEVFGLDGGVNCLEVRSLGTEENAAKKFFSLRG